MCKQGERRRLSTGSGRNHFLSTERRVGTKGTGRALGRPLHMGCRPPGEPSPSPAFLVQTVYPLFPSCSSAVAIICPHQQAWAFHTTLAQGAEDLKTFGSYDTDMDTGVLSSHCPSGFWTERGRGQGHS